LKNFNFFLLVALLTITCQPGAAHTYYVDATRGNDNHAGITPLQPWRSLTKVNNSIFLPGDSVCFNRGNSWTGQLTIVYSGSATKPITFTSYGAGSPPMIENPGVEMGSAIAIKGSWLVVDGFLVRNTHGAGISIHPGASHNVVTRNEATRTGMGIEIRGRYNLVTGNYAHDLTIIKNTPGGDDDYGAVGIWLFASNNEVSYNRMLNCRAPSYDYGYDGGMVEFYGDVDSCYVHHNWGKNCNGAFEVGGKGQTLTDIRIAYNISVNNIVSGGFHLGGLFGVKLERFRVENNVFVDTNPHEYTIGLWRGVPDSGGIQYRNNIFFIPNHKKAINQAGIVHEHNLYFLGGASTIGDPLGPGEIIADPLFVDMTNDDFRLKKGSPAIDAGTQLDYSRDYDGRIVPSGAAPDIGAFEYHP
jgi:hypothetical protein